MTNEYLYGENVEVEPIDSHFAMRRIELLSEHLEVLLDSNYMDRDLDRIRAVNKAQSFWEDMMRIER